MLSHEEALVHARQHLYSTEPPVEWVWVLRRGKRVTGGWYFDYALEPVRFIRDQEGLSSAVRQGFWCKMTARSGMSTGTSCHGFRRKSMSTRANQAAAVDAPIALELHAAHCLRRASA